MSESHFLLDENIYQDLILKTIHFPPQIEYFYLFWNTQAPF